MYKTDCFVQTPGASLARLSMHGIRTDVVPSLGTGCICVLFFLLFRARVLGGEENTRETKSELVYGSGDLGSMGTDGRGGGG